MDRKKILYIGIIILLLAVAFVINVVIRNKPPSTLKGAVNKEYKRNPRVAQIEEVEHDRLRFIIHYNDREGKTFITHSGGRGTGPLMSNLPSIIFSP